MKISLTSFLLITAIFTTQTVYGAAKKPSHSQKIAYSSKVEMPAELVALNIKLLKPIQGVSRTWKELDEEYAKRLTSVFIVMKQQHGYDMTLLEGYRSPERQDTLFAGSAGVTKARGFQSYHQYGLAADCAFIKDGKIMMSPNDAWTMRGYKLYGEVAKSVGLVWGGNWKLEDFGHTELRVGKGILSMNHKRFIDSKRILVAQR